MAERPIIRVSLPAETVEEFQRAAAERLAREFFVELDTPVVEHVRIEAPFKSGAVAVRAEAVTRAVTREGREGVLVRLTALEPNSYGVAIPPAGPWPAVEAVPVVARTTTPAPAVARTTTPHVVRRAPSQEDDPVAEFSGGSIITKTSPVSADLAKALHERPTPNPPITRAPAIIRRQTPVAGIPPVPKPVEKKITPPGVPTVDDEWSFDAPTLGPAAHTQPTGPLPIVKPDAKSPPRATPTPPSIPIPRVRPTPPAVPIVTIPTKPPEPRIPEASPKALDDDAAFDDAFGILEDDLAVPAEPAPPATAPATVEPTIEITAVPATSVAARDPAFPSEPRPDEITKPVSAAEIARAVEESARPTPPPEPESAPPHASPPANEPAPRPAPATTRPSSEGVLATARGSELVLPSSGTSELEPIEGTSGGAVASTRAVSEHVQRPRSKAPVIAGIAATLGVLVVVLVLALRGSGSESPAPTKGSPKAEVDRHLREAASRIADGKLVGRGGDAALDHLLAAKAIAPADPQVEAQLHALADTFEKLGDGALAANDLAEAATHYQAAISAEPERASAKAKLDDVETRARGR